MFFSKISNKLYISGASHFSWDLRPVVDPCIAGVMHCTLPSPLYTPIKFVTFLPVLAVLLVVLMDLGEKMVYG